ncbi:hypothetical protein SCHPADRAFT_57700 [Schizopora paradoxa]|uniref:DUF6534 domain-containing protein n=1 Tax=Schizopora paradoxa TaxID=27342 RepID=A0A0H2S619_9AGAM|nr:hypothetical protein SCHPADRAFT_57700 [Schizopora paradoxa]
MQYTIQTGLFATLWSVGSLVTFAVKPDTELSLIFYLPLSKIYVNALLASLNARESLREKSRNSKTTPRGICNEDSFNSIALNPRQTHQVDALKASGESSISTEVDDDKVTAIQVQVDRDSPLEPSPYASEMVLHEQYSQFDG